MNRVPQYSMKIIKALFYLATTRWPPSSANTSTSGITSSENMLKWVTFNCNLYHQIRILLIVSSNQPNVQYWRDRMVVSLENCRSPIGLFGLRGCVRKQTFKTATRSRYDLAAMLYNVVHLENKMEALERSFCYHFILTDSSHYHEEAHTHMILLNINPHIALQFCQVAKQTAS